jgi:hypothetical protein
MKKRNSRALGIARDMEKRGFPIAAVEKVEARLARFRAAEQAAMDPLMEDFFDELFMEDSLGEMDALIDDIHERLEYLTQHALKDPREQRKRRAAVITREIAARVDELRRSGVRNPVTQAKEEVAERWGYDNVEALDRWLRRNR